MALEKILIGWQEIVLTMMDTANCKHNLSNGLTKADIGYNYCKAGSEETHC